MTDLKKYSFLAFVFALILGFSISTAHAQVEGQEQTTQPETYMLTGKVVDATSGEALADVEVKVENPQRKEMGQSEMGMDEEGKKTETTDDQGEFTFDKLSSGEHTIKIDHEGYKTWERNVRLNQDSQLTIELQPSM